MVVGLEFSDTFDLTAVGTGLLALATVAALFFTRRSLKQTQEDIRLSRREVEEAHRPVVIPYVDPSTAPTVNSAGSLRLPIQNIGSGPALDIYVVITFEGPAVATHQLPTAPHPMGRVAGVGVSAIAWVEHLFPGLDHVPGYSLRLRYVDVAGQVWVTTCRWASLGFAYEVLNIERE